MSTLLRLLPTRGQVLLLVDRLGHATNIKPLGRAVCDAWDLYVGMDAEDFLHNDGRVPSRLAYLLAGVKR